MRISIPMMFGLILFFFSSSASAERFMTEMDLHKFVWIADPQISPDGSRIVFVRVTADTKRDGYDTSLWIVPASPAGEPSRLTSGPRDLSPQWSPDGKRIAFLRAPEKDGRAQPPQMFLLSMTGGEARQVTDLARGVGTPAWAPDGKTLLFTTTTAADDPKSDRAADIRATSA